MKLSSHLLNKKMSTIRKISMANSYPLILKKSSIPMKRNPL